MDDHDDSIEDRDADDDDNYASDDGGCVTWCSTSFWSKSTGDLAS